MMTSNSQATRIQTIGQRLNIDGRRCTVVDRVPFTTPKQRGAVAKMQASSGIPTIGIVVRWDDTQVEEVIGDSAYSGLAGDPAFVHLRAKWLGDE